MALNGTWQFQYFSSIYDVQEKFYEPDYDCSSFSEVEVPGVWQNYGYDSHQYTNVRYPIPLDPPYVLRKIHAEPMCVNFTTKNQKKLQRHI